MWFLLYLWWFFELRAVGVVVNPIAVLWVSMFFFPLSFLPVKGVAAIGPNIAAWFYSLRLVGVHEADAATAAFTAEVLSNTTVLWVGILPLLALVGKMLPNGWRAKKSAIG